MHGRKVEKIIGIAISRKISVTKLDCQEHVSDTAI